MANVIVTDHCWHSVTVKGMFKLGAKRRSCCFCGKAYEYERKEIHHPHGHGKHHPGKGVKVTVSYGPPLEACEGRGVGFASYE